jgi:phosphoglycerate dehydrogenase-like enzyme
MKVFMMWKPSAIGYAVDKTLKDSSNSDIITLHVPEMASTKNLINKTI